MVIYGWLKVAFGIFCLAKLAVASFACAKHAWQYVLTGGMILLIQRSNTCFFVLKLSSIDKLLPADTCTCEVY